MHKKLALNRPSFIVWGLECYTTATAGSKIGMTRKIVALSSFLGPWAVAAFSVLSDGKEMK